ncbi:uncharacterized protein EURHEDRAFT_410637 [Aspergillus ruber CBS 135680]|uniref:Tafazzin n=1 Tax=Aspergillus ruber (strain CBS 135680) TaxID=1388766 RepID=A0A017SJA6_ASPRC|nr:uncharacterized protein EURHEDRAFT_410637 [Aspergillus ruber CBS 135680]EYE96846.1 hypothetical protein EURHEDRAFT_410637 [Aspergillus ruber CBS 135680]
MPKKRHDFLFTKPVGTPHHTLLSSSSRSDRFQSSSSAQPSVNDLIDHLRRTQVSSSDDRTSPSSFVAPRSVHPSLRNLLELPVTPPPRPRPNARRVGVGRLRRTPGPPPPESWLLGNNQITNENSEQEDIDTTAQTERVIYRLERLPGATFPPKNGLLHMTLKAMAQHWAWHVAYDGQFLAMLPTHVKVLLLSYISVYGKDQPLGGLVRGLKPLISVDKNDEDYQGSELDGISRLDFGGALGRWMGFKELNNELFLSPSAVDLPRKSKEVVPASWEEEYEEEASAIPKSFEHGCRFENLRFLSLAHPHPSAANWKSLLKLLSRLSILTHLSLGHWPVPTLTPNAINARIRHPTHRSLTFSYSGTDTYSTMENNWAEASGILRKLSHATYCLKWLDLEGCGDWIPALSWTGHGPDGEVYHTGPEWNGAWRDIEWIRLGPGWLPHIDDAEILGLHTRDADNPPTATAIRPQQQQQQQQPYQPPAFRSLASSIHAPPTPSSSLSRIRGIETDDDDSGSDTSWDVEVERVKYRRAKELERYQEAMRTARTVQQRVQQLRREGKRKWVHFSFGIEELKEDVVRELLGKEYTDFLP